MGREEVRVEEGAFRVVNVERRGSELLLYKV
jgi:hypothetical protein